MKYFLTFIMATLILLSSDMFVCKESTIVKPNGEFTSYENLNIIGVITDKTLFLILTDKHRYSLEYKNNGKTKKGVKFDMYKTSDSSMTAGVYNNFKDGITVLMRNGYKMYITSCKGTKK